MLQLEKKSRRQFLRDLGLSAAALPFVTGLPSFAAEAGGRKQRLIIVFSPNGTLPPAARWSWSIQA